MLATMRLVAQSEPVPGLSAEAGPSSQLQAAAVVLAYLENTQLALRSKPFEVLRELAVQTQARAQAGQTTDFTAQNLKAGVAPDVAREASGWLSPHWARLIEAEQRWSEGMADAARRSGHVFVPRLKKLPGGAGNPSLYRIEAELLGPEIPTAPLPVVPEGGIYYTPESVAAPGGLFGQAFRHGIIPWSATMRGLLTAVFLTVWLGTLLWYWLLVSNNLSVTRPVSTGDLLGAMIWLLALAAIAWPFRFLSQLFTLRTMIAPDLLTPLTTDNITLELRPSTADRPGELVFARYSSTCAVCGAPVLLFHGEKDFPGRIVGRCRRSAREHVYSFDPASSTGYPLRHNRPN